MKRDIAIGELLLCLVFGGAGAFWVFHALRLQFWEGFAPATGFLPLIYGILLILLAVAATLVDVIWSKQHAEERGPIARPVMVLLALAAGVAGINLVGFFASMALAMLFLFHVAEKRPLPASLLAAGGSALGLTLAFRTWLGVPLPAGPWGF